MIPDIQKYRQHWTDLKGEGMTTDTEHLATMWALVEAERPKRIIEVGSYRGGSAWLWREALEQGIAQEVHLFDPVIRPELLALVNGSSKADGFVLHDYAFYDFPMTADLIFIDGDHQAGALADMLGAVAMGVRIIVAHDSGGYAAEPKMYADCWGSWLACNLLRHAPGRTSLEDRVRRPGCRTERGLFISIKQ